MFQEERNGLCEGPALCQLCNHYQFEEIEEFVCTHPDHMQALESIQRAFSSEHDKKQMTAQFYIVKDKFVDLWIESDTEIDDCALFKWRRFNDFERYSHAPSFDDFLSELPPFDADHLMGLVSRLAEEPTLGEVKDMHECGEVKASLEVIKVQEGKVSIKITHGAKQAIVQAKMDEIGRTFVTSCIPALLEAAE